jgi:hypothetical protein
MTQGARVVVMAAMVLFYGSLLFFWAQAGNRLSSLPAPAWLAQGDDSVLTRLDNRLFELRLDGTRVAYQQPEPGWHYNGLSRVGDDALLWRQPQAPGWLDLLLHALRLQPHEKPPTESAGLIRCRVGTGSCQAAVIPVPLDRAFHILALPSGRWLLSDTSRHRLLLLDHAGNVVDEQHGFHFPGQPVLDGNSVWLADTNNHRVVQLQPDVDSIGAVVAAVPVPQRGPWRWPTAVLPLVDGWWVLVGDSRLSRDRILVFDRDWQYQRDLDLPEGADLEAMARLGDHVLVSDIVHRQIYGLDLQGNMIGVWQGEPLYSELLGLQHEAARLGRHKGSLMILFAILLIPGFWLAWKIDGKRFSERQRQRVGVAVEAVGELSVALPRQVVWASHNRMIRLRWLVLFLPLSFVSFLAIDPGVEVLMVFSATALVALAAFLPLHCVAGSAIGVGPDGVVVRDYLGRQRCGRGAEVILGSTTLAVGDLIVQIGNQQQPLFDRQFLKETLFPHLGDATRIGGLEECARLWRSDYQRIRLAMVATFLGLAIMVGQMVVGG